jgi:hypothetical protein
MRKIGIVASESSEVGGKVLLQAGEGVNETLTVGAYRPGVAYAKRGGTPSSAREIFSFNINVIGCCGEGGIEPNKVILAPRSAVYAFEPGDSPNPMEMIAQGKDVVWIGNYEGLMSGGYLLM